MLVALFALLVVASANYDVIYILTNNCQSGPDLTSLVGYTAIAPTTCQTGCAQQGANFYYSSCNIASVPTIPTSTGEYVISTSSYADNTCGSSIPGAIAVDAVLANTCIDALDQTTGALYSFVASCSPASLNVWDHAGCNGTAFGGGPAADISQPCYSLPVEFGAGLSASGSCFSNTCFHSETEITYGKQTMTMKALADHADCAIPHVVKTEGVRIETTCGSSLRLTRDHLVYTQSGLRTAGSVKVGDFLYNDMTEKNVCEVTGVHLEHGQEYFGLNCEESIVLANGYKTSTFGVVHDLPAIWMKYASKILGVDVASSFGDMVVNLLKQWKLF